ATRPPATARPSLVTGARRRASRTASSAAMERTRWMDRSPSTRRSAHDDGARRPRRSPSRSARAAGGAAPEPHRPVEAQLLRAGAALAGRRHGPLPVLPRPQPAGDQPRAAPPLGPAREGPARGADGARRSGRAAAPAALGRLDAAVHELPRLDRLLDRDRLPPGLELAPLRSHGGRRPPPRRS